jgi:hypothetical protein
MYHYIGLDTGKKGGIFLAKSLREISARNTSFLRTFFFIGLCLMALAHRRAGTRHVSPIPMERNFRRFACGEHVRERWIEAGATSELLGHLIVVIPADRLEEYRFTFVGSEVIAHFGRDISPDSFAEILRSSSNFRPCLEQSEKSLRIDEKVVSRHRYDFADMWVVEYSRVIYPVTAGSRSTCVISHDVFHDHSLEGRYF